MGLCIPERPVRKKLPIAYSYNGVVLPKLPEWDRVKYPYAFIAGDSAEGYILRFLSVLPAVVPPGVSAGWSDASIMYYKTSGTSGDGWIFDSASDGSTGRTFMSGVIWSNADIKYGDTIQMAGSDPVPVYE